METKTAQCKESEQSTRGPAMKLVLLETAIPSGCTVYLQYAKDCKGNMQMSCEVTGDGGYP